MPQASIGDICGASLFGTLGTPRIEPPMLSFPTPNDPSYPLLSFNGVHISVLPSLEKNCSSFSWRILHLSRTPCPQAPSTFHPIYSVLPILPPANHTSLATCHFAPERRNCSRCHREEIFVPRNVEESRRILARRQCNKRLRNRCLRRAHTTDRIRA